MERKIPLEVQGNNVQGKPPENSMQIVASQILHPRKVYILGRKTN